MKPNVICLMASSVDGRTLHSRWRPKGTGAALFEQVHDELGGDAWLIGRVTGQEFAKGKPYPTVTQASFPREPWFANRDAKAYGVVLDARGKIAWRGDPPRRSGECDRVDRTWSSSSLHQRRRSWNIFRHPSFECEPDYEIERRIDRNDPEAS